MLVTANAEQRHLLPSGCRDLRARPIVVAIGRRQMEILSRPHNSFLQFISSIHSSLLSQEFSPRFSRLHSTRMPKYYCDYCDTYLTHDSPSVRKTHCQGRKHKENVRDYYQKWMEEQAQKLVSLHRRFLFLFELIQSLSLSRID